MRSRPEPRRPDPPAAATADSSSEDWLLDVADRYKRRGLLLKQLVDRQNPRRAYREVFHLTRDVNPPNFSYGFFDTLQVPDGALPVMGNVQEMFFDRVRTPRELFDERRQLREFVLRYFMRVSDFTLPSAYVGGAASAQTPSRLDAISWCARSPDAPRDGFGFSQLFAKRLGSGTIERFSERERFAIIDLREIGRTYEWLIVKVQLFNFSFRFGIPGTSLSVVVPLEEESYLILSPDFLTDDPQGGRFGLGYAFIRDRELGVLRYGPGAFDAAYEQIDFWVDGDGQVRVRMFFAANRPTAIARVPLDVPAWAARALNVVTFGAAQEVFDDWEARYRRLAITWPTVDPVYLFIALANVLTLGQAAEQACISTDQPDRLFLARHFEQHYQAISGSLVTWRQVPDWTDANRLPDWVRTGGTA